MDRGGVEQLQQLLGTLSPDQRLAGLSADQIRQHLDRLTARRPATPRKQRRKR